MPCDKWKDQTLFLCQIGQEALRKTMFPLSEMTKSEARKIAVEHGLQRIAEKKESMGICFIGNREFKSFIAEVSFESLKEMGGILKKCIFCYIYRVSSQATSKFAFVWKKC